MSASAQARLRLIASCPDRTGIVARVATFLAERGASITEAAQYNDPRSEMFFMRSEFVIGGDAEVLARLEKEFQPIGTEMKMAWRMVDAQRRQRVVLLVSKFDHCLAYLLHRRKVGDLEFDVPCVISNHEDLRSLVEWYGIPYHYVPVPKESAGKQAALEKTAQLISEAEPDTIVLARYMQIFPPWLCERYRHRVINIHHSFLPSFVGGKPYHQAEERGVKLIGATCHYVTEELDAGPIIEQDVVRIRHSDTIKDMMRLGKDVENAVLSRGLRYHLEDRVLVHGNKTILFSG
ncbi:formyltetrahydrofolate deformylase [Horticoccus luteus]|uniref:Formyltetrahydrofolate deformylase n=1 Tax=Horticoccus luteus TaxID=2862869 RepID=A0A8F9TV68_9BACT|nr:formyltetrahydrofolate deformylase [Horticoccus luteus]QYM79859.1 formyltetrahydrofolate deformylase [Horticoccus luteus]